MTLDMAQVYTDFSGLAALRARAREDQQAALDQVSRQFESLFLQMMLKNMRDASFGGGLMDSKQSDFYREMYDKQIAMDIAEKPGIGLAEVIKRQLGGGAEASREGLNVQDYIEMPRVTGPRPGKATLSTEARYGYASDALDGSPDTFLRKLWPMAQKAAARLDLPPEALLAQAALETGWGRHVMRHASGDSSHNLFGIKADSRWEGDRVQVSTLEYRDGVALKTRARFRAYDSYDESFADYVDFVQRNPRYREALKNTQDPADYFRSLQAAGYATDPDYAEKIKRILDSESMQRAAQDEREGRLAT
jgi:flagellar protein FlgJ